MENNKKEKTGIKIDKASFISYKTNNINKDYTLGKTVKAHLVQCVKQFIKQQNKKDP